MNTAAEISPFLEKQINTPQSIPPLKGITAENNSAESKSDKKSRSENLSKSSESAAETADSTSSEGTQIKGKKKGEACIGKRGR